MADLSFGSSDLAVPPAVTKLQSHAPRPTPPRAPHRPAAAWRNLRPKRRLRLFGNFMNLSTTLPVVLPIFSGLTFLAYKHPEGYARLLKRISKWAYPVAVIAVGYLAGKQDAAQSLASVTYPDVAAKVASILKGVDEGYTVVFLYIGGAWLYLAILTYLPDITQPQSAPPQATGACHSASQDAALEPTLPSVASHAGKRSGEDSVVPRS